MKTRLFNEYEAYTEDAVRLSFQLKEAIIPILQEASLKFPLRDIEVVAVAIMGNVTSELIIRAALSKAELEDDQYNYIDH